MASQLPKQLLKHVTYAEKRASRPTLHPFTDHAGK